MNKIPKPTEIDYEADAVAHGAVSKARQAAIEKLIADGYKLPDGTERKVRSAAHAEFLATSGLVTLPE